MDRRIPKHELMDKLLIDTTDGDMLVIVASKDLSSGHNGMELWEVIIHEYSPHNKDGYYKYHSWWEPDDFDDFVEATSTTMKLYGPPELLDYPLSDLYDKLVSADWFEPEARGAALRGPKRQS